MEVVRAGGAVSQSTTGAVGITMKVQEVPPGARSQPHFHQGFESAVYVVSGRLVVRWGDRLEEHAELGEGDLLYVPPQETHVVENPAADTPCRYVVARDSPTEDAVTVPWAADPA